MNIANVVSLAEARERLHLSASQLRTYVNCSEQYRHRYVLRTPPSHRSSALAFGSAVHSALAAFYLELQDTGDKIATEDLQGAFDESWQGQLAPGDVRFGDKEDADTLQAKGHTVLAVFQEQGLVPDEVLGVETPFALPLPDREEELVGAFDLVCRHGNKTVVVEHKTAARKKSEDDLRYDLQGTVYALAARQLGFTDAEVVFQIVTKTKKPAIQLAPVVRNDSHLAELDLVIDNVLRGIEAGVFFPNRSWMCTGCPYQHVCGVR